MKTTKLTQRSNIFLFANKKYLGLLIFTSILCFLGCKKEADKIVLLPTLTSVSITNITANSATSGGSITNDGGASITAKGIVWGIDVNPVVSLTTKTSEGVGISNFSSSLEIVLEL